MQRHSRQGRLRRVRRPQPRQGLRRRLLQQEEARLHRSLRWPSPGGQMRRLQRQKPGCRMRRCLLQRRGGDALRLPSAKRGEKGLRSLRLRAQRTATPAAAHALRAAGRGRVKLYSWWLTLSGGVGSWLLEVAPSASFKLIVHAARAVSLARAHPLAARGALRRSQQPRRRKLPQRLRLHVARFVPPASSAQGARSLGPLAAYRRAQERCSLPNVRVRLRAS